MRYFCYDDYSVGIKVVSENDIRETYYPFWYEQMCEKHGKDKVDKFYSFQECLEDWVVLNRARESG